MESLSDVERSELQVTLATFILHDAETEISADNINKIVEASGGEIEAHWASTFASLLKDRDVQELLDNAGAAGPSSGGAAGGAAGAAPAAAAEEGDADKPAEEAEEEEESDDAGGAMGLFGSDSDDSDDSDSD